MTRTKLLFTKTLQILKDTGSSLKRGEPVIYSAAIAFFTIFSLPAILIVITLIGSTLFSGSAVQDEIVRQIEDLISKEAGEQVGVVLRNVTKVPEGIWGILIAVVVVVKSASAIFFIMQKAMNSVWQVRVKRQVKYLRYVKHRLATLALVVGLGVLLLVSLLLDTLIHVFREELYTLLENYFGPTVTAINTAFYLLVILLFFTSILKVLPDVRVAWEDALVGGGITSLLFLGGKELINFILLNIKVVGIYSAAGSLVVLLLWVFYSSIILFLGAEITRAYAQNQGRETEPNEIAIKYKKVIQEEG